MLRRMPRRSHDDCRRKLKAAQAILRRNADRRGAAHDGRKRVHPRPGQTPAPGCGPVALIRRSQYLFLGLAVIDRKPT
jgi:hypothetical protein